MRTTFFTPFDRADIQSLITSMDYSVGGFEQVEDDDRAVSKRSCSIAFRGGLVGVDVMCSAEGFVKLVSWARVGVAEQEGRSQVLGA